MEIKKDEFYKRLATEVMMSMSDVYYDDLKHLFKYFS